MAKSYKLKENFILPIHKYKEEILRKLKTHQVLIITGETGCGKSTQLPKYLHEFGYTKHKMIVCLHPRCVTAMTLSNRVAEELSNPTGQLVGYRIRFDSNYSYNTKIMFMTTGFMIKLIVDDKGSYNNSERYENKWINKYSVIIIDEAHERSIETDIMLGKMKQILEQNRTIKLVIMSATINVHQFIEYYQKCGLVEITEKMNTVKVIYRPLKSENYMKEIKNLVEEILINSSKGDVLIFLHTEMKVRKCRQMLKGLPKTIVLKFFASMDYDSKMKIFKDYRPRRKIIISTNVAETSLTIPGVDYVIDSGAVQRISFNHETWTELWISKYISVAEAEQRKGRTGRTRLGYCYRLYEESFMRIIDAREDDESHDIPDYNIVFPYYCSSKVKDVKYESSNKLFHPFPEAEILEANLGTMILTIKSFGTHNVMRFPFIVNPKEAKVASIIKQLINLSLLSNEETLTKLGMQVSFVPLEPRLGKVAIMGSKLICRDSILIIVAMLSVKNTFKFSNQNIHSYHGDMFYLLDIYEEGRANRFNKNWCKENYINHYNIIYVTKVYHQLDRYLPQSPRRNECKLINVNSIKIAFLSGFFQNIAEPIDDNNDDPSNEKCYMTYTGEKAIIHIGSSLHKSNVTVMFQNLHKRVNDSKLILRNCVAIDNKLLYSIKPKQWKINSTLWKRILDRFCNTMKDDLNSSSL